MATGNERASGVEGSIKQEARSKDWIIVGAGRIGNALFDMGSGKDVLVRREDVVPEVGSSGLSAGVPVLVATRNDDLGAVISATPSERRRDLVFIQNGMLDPFLEDKGLDPGENCTQALIYFAVAKRGDAPVDGSICGPIGDEGVIPPEFLEPESQVCPLTHGLTAACGPHALAFAERLWAHGLTCRVLDRQSFRQAMLEKLVWISAYMLVGVVHGGVKVGQVVKEHRREVDALIAELMKAGAAAAGVDLKTSRGASLKAGAEEDVLAEILERLAAYSACVADYPTALKEVPWRNGFFCGLSKAAQSEGHADPCPLHSRLMQEATTGQKKGQIQ